VSVPLHLVISSAAGARDPESPNACQLQPSLRCVVLSKVPDPNPSGKSLCCCDGGSTHFTYLLFRSLCLPSPPLRIPTLSFDPFLSLPSEFESRPSDALVAVPVRLLDRGCNPSGVGGVGRPATAPGLPRTCRVAAALRHCACLRLFGWLWRPLLSAAPEGTDGTSS